MEPELKPKSSNIDTIVIILILVAALAACIVDMVVDK